MLLIPCFISHFIGYDEVVDSSLDNGFATAAAKFIYSTMSNAFVSNQQQHPVNISEVGGQRIARTHKMMLAP